MAVVITFCVASSPVRGDIPDIEKASLRRFYSALGGDSWDNASGWDGLFNATLYSDPCSSPRWHGIDCDSSNSHISKLYFVSNGLAGTLPDDMLDGFTGLEEVSLGNGAISGTLPASLVCGSSATEHIRHLAVYNNNLTGNLPRQTCFMNRSSSAAWTIFSVSNNSISGTIPPALLCSSPSADNNINIYLGFNKLSGTLPSQVCFLNRSSNAALQLLELVSNAVSGTVPPGVLCGNPAANQLSTINIGNNHFSGTLPHQACLLNRSADAALGFFAASDNLISGTIPEALVCGTPAAEQMIFVDLGVNCLSGVLPSQTCFMNRSSKASLQFFNINNNTVSGTIPPAMVCGTPAAESMQTLSLFNNAGISGTLPDHACLAARSPNSSLTSFYVSNVSISGTIPSSMLCGNPAANAMRDIHIGNSFLSGTLPSNLCFKSRTSPLLAAISVSASLLSGSIPDELVCGTHLTLFACSDCKLSGTLPPCLNLNATAMNVLDVQRNNLKGVVPDIQQWAMLEVLTLSGNKFANTSLALPPSIVSLFAENVGLRGDLRFLANATRLQNIYLAGNSLSGTIPSKMFLFSDLRQVSLTHNRISGSIPDTVASAKSLERLLIDHNRINGRLPSALASVLPALDVLELDLNELSCELPTLLGSLSTWPPNTRVLEGNVFGCPGLEHVSNLDATGKSYLCGNKAFVPPLVALVVAMTTLGALVLTCCCTGNTTNILWSWWSRLGADSPLQIAARNSVRTAAFIIALTAQVVLVAVPVYSTAESLVQCQYLHRPSLAFTSGASSTASPIYFVEWAVASLLAVSVAAIVKNVQISRPNTQPNALDENITLADDTTLAKDATLAIPLDDVSNGYASDTKSNGRTKTRDSTRRSVDELLRRRDTVVATRRNGCSIQSGAEAAEQVDFRFLAWIKALGRVCGIAAVFVVTLAIIMSTSVAQVAVNLSKLEYQIKQFLTYALAGAHVAMSVTIYPRLSKYMVHLVVQVRRWCVGDSGVRVATLRGKSQVALLLFINTVFHTLSNVVAPALAEAFGDSSCLKPILISPNPYPITLAGGSYDISCQSAFGKWLHCQKGQKTIGLPFGVYAGGYTPPFDIRRDYCTSQLIRIFTPFFVASVLEFLVSPVLEFVAGLIYANPPGWARVIFGRDDSCATWPILTEDFTSSQLAEVGDSLICRAHEAQLYLLSIFLTMGIASPLVAVATAFASAVTALNYVYKLSTIHGLTRERKGDVKNYLTVDGSIPIASAIVPCVGAFLFWSIFGWVGLEFSWAAGAFCASLLLLCTHFRLVWTGVCIAAGGCTWCCKGFFRVA